jgi:hypothetical protein
MPSNLFTPTELKALNQRLKGSKKDPTGIYAARVKPKIIELLSWIKRKKELERLIS